MANLKHLKHLEHLEDEMLNYGVEGCEKIVMDLVEARKMLGNSDVGYMQTKWDGAPAVVCGKEPLSGEFFVGTKSVFNKTDPLICCIPEACDEKYPPAVAAKLKWCLKYLPELGIDGVIQGDLMFAPGDVSEFTDAQGKRSWKFGLNTITYSIPKDHELGQQVSKAKIGFVFHTHYNGASGTSLSDMQAVAGVGERLNNSDNVMVIDNDTPYHNVGLSAQEGRKFDSTVASIKKECGTCGDFLDELVLKGGGQGNPKGEDKFHIAPYLKKYFNHEIAKDKVTTKTSDTIQGLVDFYYHAMEKLIDGVSGHTTRAQKIVLVKNSLNYLMENESKFASLIELYRLIQSLKQQIIDKLDALETFGTYVLKDNSYKVTTPEGYVLHREGNMVKLVNRLEFSKNNFMAGQFQQKAAKVLDLNYARHKGYPGKKIVIGFGRFNPPTKGHYENLNEIANKARTLGADDYRMYITQGWEGEKTKGKKPGKGNDPLPPDVRLKWMQKMFSEHKNHVVSDSTMRTMDATLKSLMMEGFRHVIFLSGDKDVRERQYVLRYDGKPPWNFAFFTLVLESSGKRMKGVSGTDQRINAVKRDLPAFSRLVRKLNRNEQIAFMDEIRKYMPATYTGK